MEILIIIFAVLTLVIGAVQCFVGYKSIKEFPAVMGFVAGASLGASVGFILQNLLVGAVLFCVLGIVNAIASYIWKSFGILSISACYCITACSLLFGFIFPGIVAALVCILFTMFFYKLGSVISSALYGSALIIFSAFVIIGENTIPQSVFILAFIIWIVASLAGSACQILTTFYDDFGQRNIIDTIYDFSESKAPNNKRYHGFQKLYRNFCIKCGYDVHDLNGKCPRCGFDFDK